jgi:hypothetical protein
MQHKIVRISGDDKLVTRNRAEKLIVTQLFKTSLQLHKLYGGTLSQTNNIMVIKSRNVRWARYTACRESEKYTQNFSKNT